MALHFKTFSARDARGHEILLYEMRDTAALFGLRGRLRIELGSGEQVEQLDEDTFVSVKHHEILRRITDPGDAAHLTTDLSAGRH